MISVLLAWGLAIVVLSMPRHRPVAPPTGRGWRRVRAEWWFAWEEARGFVVGLFVSGWYCAVLVLLELRS